MAAERKPGSDRGRPATDWKAAFLTYAALPPTERSYQTVADRHDVSVRTVERHGRKDNWKARAAELDREAQTLAAAHLAEERAAKLGDVEKLVDATFVYYASQIRDGKVKVSVGDIRRLHELRAELWADPANEPPPPPDPIEPGETADPTEHKLEVLRALRDAGVLDTTDEQHRPDGDQDDEQATHHRDHEDDQREVA
jgi:hypothetical protein